MTPDVKEGAVIISNLLTWLGIKTDENTARTPERVAKSYIELFSGLYEKAPEITTFSGEEGYVAVTNIPFVSMCSHHLMPFSGSVGVVYHSSGKVIGLSKIPRIINYWAARPNLQEDLTMQIASDIMKRLKPYGIYVAITASHSCMEHRGVKAHGAVTNTATVLGDIDKREAISLLQMTTTLQGGQHGL